ncbi:NlpC/P60 family protein [Nocardioides sp. MAHUQ-72]|uniref:C40 family peptidase n=1 Tax=unclassified Nocardioides TaxID=2615069 RepID=UPI003608B9DA
MVGVVPSTPAGAEPSIDDVKSRVDTLYHQAEQASERYNDARLELKELNQELVSLKADQARQDKRLGAVQEQVKDSIVHQYEGESLSAVGEVVVSDDPQAFLSQLSTMSAFNDMQGQLFDDYATEAKALDIRRSATEKRAARIAELKKGLAEDKAAIDDKLSEAKSLLGKLEAEQRDALTSRSTTRTPEVSASGRAAAAVQYAMAQVGKAYVYGAAGPSAFDCSGLTMMAWAQAGVALPHSSSAQYNSGPHIPESELMPGDLVFYYSPISHVGMYIGNGMIVNAENPSAGVKVTSLHTMPYVGAVRPG